jgi:glyoxylase-like metal-dependent hydrolase (beta-lactamase superfamily II)
MNRILLMGSTLGLLAAVSLAEPNDPIKEIPLGERVLVLQHCPWAENITVLDAGPSLVVVDTWSSPQAAARAKALIDKRFHKPVSHVINTHYHWDHTFGNQVFAGTVIVGHASCVEPMNAEYRTPELRLKALDQALQGTSGQMREFLTALKAEVGEGFRLTIPNHLVTDRDMLRVGDLSICLYHVPGLHTVTNLTIHVPELGLLFTRREFNKGSLPILEPGLDMTKLIASLEAVQATGRPVRYLVCGHGDPVENPDLAAPLAYLRLLAKTVQTARQQGRTLDQNRDDASLNAIPEVAKYPKVHQANLELLWGNP